MDWGYSFIPNILFTYPWEKKNNFLADYKGPRDLYEVHHCHVAKIKYSEVLPDLLLDNILFFIYFSYLHVFINISLDYYDNKWIKDWHTKDHVEY